jgi:hypothetical protein
MRRRCVLLITLVDLPSGSRPCHRCRDQLASGDALHAVHPRSNVAWCLLFGWLVNVVFVQASRHLG